VLASSDDARELWLAERRTRTLTQFDTRIPALYREPVELPLPAYAWALGTGSAPASLFLTGRVGVGKTHTAWHAARQWLAHRADGDGPGVPVIQTWRSTAFFDALRPDAGNPRDVTKAAQECDLLYLDDLAAARVSPSGWTQERLYELFDERYVNQRPVLITCDVLPGQLSPVVGERVASRLAEMCAGGVHLMRGPDRRKQTEEAGE